MGYRVPEDCLEEGSQGKLPGKSWQSNWIMIRGEICFYSQSLRTANVLYTGFLIT